MNRPGPEETRSAFRARGDAREYNVYIQTAAVEDAWPDIAGWPLGPEIGPLLISLEVALKILDETLDEAGTRTYLNDGAKAEAVAASVGAVPYVSESNLDVFFRNFQKLFPRVRAGGRARGRRAGRQPSEGGVAHRGRVLPAEDGGALRRHRDVSTSIRTAASAPPSPTGTRTNWPRR